MPALATTLPVRRPELVIRPLGDRGRYVVKDPASGAYFHLGAEEHFLLEQLDGAKEAASVCAAFVQRFGQPLSEEELDQFIELARGKGFLKDLSLIPDPLPPMRQTQDAGRPKLATRDSKAEARTKPQRSRQSILYWRKSLFDPDRLCTWLEPEIRFFWTRAFLVLSAACILLAAVLTWTHGKELASSFAHVYRWETWALAWLILLLVTTLHEFAHGLTCKHHGGEVHEIGFLLMFFMPCFYCNVSDAWLFKEKSKRLWVTFAGGYFELFIWAVAVFVWRLTLQDSLVNYLAWLALAVTGVQIFFNFNPLLKLDGYYLLSDWLELPNLRQRSWDRFTATLRWLLWGGPRPAREPRSRLLLGFGLASWLYSLCFLTLMLWGFFRFFWVSWGWLGLAAVLLLGWASMRGMFRGFAAGEVRNMIFRRLRRTAVWLLLLGGATAALCFVHMEDRVGGTFQVRAVGRAELRAPVAGFVREVYFDEGERVSPGALVVRLEVPDLISRLAQKRAEVREAQAQLRLLEAGSRPEEIAEQRRRVERNKGWRDLAQQDVSRARQALEAELARLDQQISQWRAELDSAQDALSRAAGLRSRNGAIAEEHYKEIERKYHVAQALLAQAQSQKRHREALGTREAIAGLDAEAELARREKDLADSEGVLTLLEAGARPEQIEAARAHAARLVEEVRYLEELQTKREVVSPVAGLVSTPRLKEKAGQYVREGELICLVEEPGVLEAEIAVAEQDLQRLRLGQPSSLKARGLPFETISARVDRIAPAAASGDVQSTVTVYCRLQQTSGSTLRPGMTGHARIDTGRRVVGEIALDRVMRFLRTEFWW